MGNLLMIAYKFPPMHNTSCVRTWGFYRHIKPFFDDVLVISTSNRHILRQEPVDMEGVRVFDADTWDYRTIFQSNKSKQSVLRDETKESAAGRLGQKLTASFPTMYLFGEGGIRYILNGVRTGRQLIEKYDITHIFSTFSPFADHLIAYRLKKRYPHLFWIADFRDLHVDPTQDNLLFRDYQRTQNAKVLAAANCVTTVSEGLAEHLREFNNNVYVLRNGIEEFPDDAGVAPFRKFTLSYTGSMYADKRNPEPLLQVLSEMLNSGEIKYGEIEIRYAGKDSDVWQRLVDKYSLDAIFYDEGLVSRERALEIQRKSHVNLLLTYSSDELTGNVTGKIFEYMRAMRPIHVIINGPQDEELEGIMNGIPGGVYYMKDTGRLKTDLRQMIRAHRDNAFDSAGMEEAVQPFLWANAIQGFADHIGLDNISN